MTRLSLGTAQWGAAYGATNSVGHLPDEVLDGIVAVAREWGITDVDTAANYGDAQRRLRPWAREFTVTTKVSASGDVEGELEAALDDLGLERVHAVLLHYWDEADDSSRERAVRALRRAVDDDLIAHAGVSVYDEQGVASAIATFARSGLTLGALQVPANALDRRLDSSALLSELAEAGCDITVRSAFLQGILLTPLGGRSDHPHVARFRTWAESEHGGSLTVACLSHVRSLTWASHVVVGVTGARELSEICAAWGAGLEGPAPSAVGSDDLDLIDPRRW